MSSGFVDYNGARLFYRKQGCGPTTLVFVHGDDSNSVVWRCQQDFFSRKYQTVAIDMRGFGNSTKTGSLTAESHRDDLRAVIKALKIKNPVLIGWSTGGLVVQSYALQYPRETAKLVLVDTAPQLIKSPRFPYGRTAEEQVKILEVIKTDFRRYAREGAQKAVPEDLAVRRKIKALILETGQKVAYRQTSENASFSVVDKLSTITMPTMIVVGGKDEVLSPNCSFFMRAMIPNSQVVEFHHAGHAPFLTFNDQFNQVLLHFLEDNFQLTPCKAFIDGPLVYPVEESTTETETEPQQWAEVKSRLPVNPMLTGQIRLNPVVNTSSAGDFWEGIL